MPLGSYEKIKVVNKDNKRSITHFICRYRNCNAMFTKSTSLIVHYWRHINVRPFTCNLCNTSFTQSGTLSRHNRAVHKIHATVSLTKEQVNTVSAVASIATEDANSSRISGNKQQAEVAYASQNEI